MFRAEAQRNYEAAEAKFLLTTAAYVFIFRHARLDLALRAKQHSAFNLGFQPSLE